jgi:DNA-binding transcriptional MocR family regulator
LKIAICRGAKTPVYLQIAEQIRRQIETGELAAGHRLPSERRLAESLGVNRTTVLNAYNELKAEGLLGAHVGNGTIVSAPDGAADTWGGASGEPIWNQLFSRYTGRFDSGLVGELLELASRTDFISFATGIASPDCGPAEMLRGLERELYRKENVRALVHSPTEGFYSLRRAMCALMRKRGVYCGPEEVMMLAGSQQGIDLTARVFVDPGDIVVLEEPTYFPAIQVFRTVGARILTVPVDENGMRLDVLEQLLGRYRPKLIYTIPTYQNPTGAVMELGRRKRLVELAAKNNVVVLEDDAYGELCYEGTQPPLLKALDDKGFVIYLSTFSKNVYSGLRLGWIVADRRIVRAISSSKQLTDLHSSSLSQWIIERFITGGMLEEHLKNISAEYKERRDIMVGALSRFAPPGLSWNRPAGGYYIWCRLPGGLSSAALMAKAADYKVSFVPARAVSFLAVGRRLSEAEFHVRAERQDRRGRRKAVPGNRRADGGKPGADG